MECRSGLGCDIISSAWILPARSVFVFPSKVGKLFLSTTTNSWPTKLVVCTALLGILCASASAQSTTVLEGVDRRPSLSLDGDWHYMVDPYYTGLYTFHHEEKKNGWFLNEQGK